MAPTVMGILTMSPCTGCDRPTGMHKASASSDEPPWSARAMRWDEPSVKTLPESYGCHPHRLGPSSSTPSQALGTQCIGCYTLCQVHKGSGLSGIGEYFGLRSRTSQH